MSHIVWAVTRGAYDAHTVVAVFQTEADAEAAVVAGMGDGVEEIDFYAPGAQPTKTTEATWSCYLNGESGELLDGWRPSNTSPADIRPQISRRFSHPAEPGDGPQESAVIYWHTRTAPNPQARWLIRVTGPDAIQTHQKFLSLIARARADITEGA